MRSTSIGTMITVSAISLLILTHQASALSVLRSAPDDNLPPVETATVTAPATPIYLEKRSLPAITSAMRVNREHRRMFSDLSGKHRDTAFTKYIRALDVRYSVLTAVGNSLIKAETPEEVAEATAIAETVLAIRTDLDRAISDTQMAIIDSARISKSYFGACNTNGELADGTKCHQAKGNADIGVTPFWVQPWDADNYDIVEP